MSENDVEESWETPDELQQLDTEPLFKAIPVGVENIVRARILPARLMTNGSQTAPKDGTTNKLLGASDQRMSCVISTSSAGVFISSDAAVQGSYLPINQSRPYPYSGEIFITCLAAEPAAALVSYDCFLTED